MVLYTAAKVTNAPEVIAHRAKRALERVRESDGQDLIEYIGMVAVVAILIGAVIAFVPGLGGDIKKDITNIVHSFLGDGTNGAAGKGPDGKKLP
ncbi:MAG: hypothetical protein J2O48_01890 [Solirubrobacterales bacterium]|nr:hypothetical protein [Solirubrobacterales bacterium]